MGSTGNTEESPGREDSPRAFRKLLVVAAARSGTHYAAEVFRRAGLAVKHENTNTDGSVSCFLAAHDYYYHGRHVDGGLRDYVWGTILHQVRHPLDAIGSLAGYFTPQNRNLWFWHWQEKHTGVSYALGPVACAARYWLAWSQRCEALAEFTYRMESMREAWPEIARRVPGLSEFPEDVDPVAVSRTRIPVTFDHLKSLDAGLSEEIRRTAERYGYEV